MKRILIFSLCVLSMGGLLARPAEAQRSKVFMRRALSRCEDFKRQVKNDIYIPQAMLNEKENCVIREFASVIKEDSQDIIDEKIPEHIKDCVKASLSKENGFELEPFQKCIGEKVEELSDEIDDACEDVPKFLKVGLGKQSCEEALILFVAKDFKQVLNPDPPKWIKMYNDLRQILKPIFPWAFYVALLVILIYFADLFWHEQYRWIQMGVVTFIYSAMLVLHLFKSFYLGPLINIILIIIIIFWNHRPKKKELDIGIDLDTALKYYDRDHKSDQESDSTDSI